MKTTKYIVSEGLAFGEETDMKKLQLKSKEGWHLEKFAFMGYTLKKGEPAEYIYDIDYRKLEDAEQDEYLNLFAESGWTHVTSDLGTHIFRASPGTKPIFSDQETIAEKHHNSGKTLLSLTLTLISLTIFAWVGFFLSSGTLENVLTNTLTPLTVITIPITWTLLTIYKNKWIAQEKKGLVQVSKTFPYLCVIFSAIVIFFFSDHVHKSLRVISYMILGATAGVIVLSLVQMITLQKVRKV